ncbi:hypothetical protein D3C72_683750 [compost metagenome]
MMRLSLWKLVMRCESRVVRGSFSFCCTTLTGWFMYEIFWPWSNCTSAVRMVVSSCRITTLPVARATLALRSYFM